MKNCCPICLDDFASADDDVKVIVTKCNHAFHTECLETWLSRRGTCPTCRFRLHDEEKEEDEEEDVDDGNISIVIYMFLLPRSPPPTP